MSREHEIIEQLSDIRSDVNSIAWCVVIVVLASIGSCAYNMKISERTLAIAEQVAPEEKK